MWCPQRHHARPFLYLSHHPGATPPPGSARRQSLRPQPASEAGTASFATQGCPATRGTARNDSGKHRRPRRTLPLAARGGKAIVLRPVPTPCTPMHRVVNRRSNHLWGPGQFANVVLQVVVKAVKATKIEKVSLHILERSPANRSHKSSAADPAGMLHNDRVKSFNQSLNQRSAHFCPIPSQSPLLSRVLRHRPAVKIQCPDGISELIGIRKSGLHHGLSLQMSQAFDRLFPSPLPYLALHELLPELATLVESSALKSKTGESNRLFMLSSFNPVNTQLMVLPSPNKNT